MRIFADDRCLLHPAPAGFPERPERLARTLRRLDADGTLSLVRRTPEAADDERTLAAVERVHAAGHAARLERAARRGDALFDTADNPLGTATFEAALAAAGSALAALDETMTGAERATFAAVRPPGHHAERSQAMGFCYFNNVAIAASEARTRHGVERLAIYDFDVHHGNGTQHLFEEDPDVFYVSSHQFPFYPGTGAAGERGVGAGEGATLNLPLPAGGGDAEYREQHRTAVFPALRAFRPELLLVSAGFDAWRGDPLGGMQVSGDGFAEWGRELRELAGELCGGRIVSILEGGYDLEALPGLIRGYLTGHYAEFT